jgi:hypothetical protein
LAGFGMPLMALPLSAARKLGWMAEPARNNVRRPGLYFPALRRASLA